MSQLAAPTQLETLNAWELFVLRHRKRGNLVIHFFSFVLYYLAWVMLAVTWNPWWIAGLFASGAMGSMGHYLFDDGGVNLKEATWDPKVPLFVTIMFYQLARGTYWDEVNKAQDHYEAWIKAHGDEHAAS